MISKYTKFTILVPYDANYPAKFDFKDQHCFCNNMIWKLWLFSILIMYRGDSIFWPNKKVKFLTLCVSL